MSDGSGAKSLKFDIHLHTFWPTCIWIFCKLEYLNKRARGLDVLLDLSPDETNIALQIMAMSLR